MSLTAYNPSAVNAQARNIVVGADYTITAAQTSDIWGIAVSATGPAGGGAGEHSRIHITAAAEIGV